MIDEGSGDPLLKRLGEALRHRGVLAPIHDPEALERWLENADETRVHDGDTVEEPYPPGWVAEFAHAADFARSFARLRGRRHFYAEALRGCIRSLELRFLEAEEHFERAERLYAKTPDSVLNQRRYFLLRVWSLEKTLTEGLTEAGELRPPKVPQRVLEEDPLAKHVLCMARNAEAVLRLYRGEWHAALEIFRSLASSEVQRQDIRAMNYVGTAACEHNLGFDEAARENLRNAGLALVIEGSLLNRANVSSKLCAFYRCMGDAKEASCWKQYLMALPCPEATKIAFLRRADLLLQRCAQKASLVLL